MSDGANNGFIVAIVLGMAIGIGKLLESNEPISIKRVIGRCLISGGLGGAGGLVYLFNPEIHPVAMMAAGCALVSLGTSGIEILLSRYRGE